MNMCISSPICKVELHVSLSCISLYRTSDHELTAKVSGSQPPTLSARCSDTLYADVGTFAEDPSYRVLKPPLFDGSVGD
jgi:hypothetical protein